VSRRIGRAEIEGLSLIDEGAIRRFRRLLQNSEPDNFTCRRSRLRIRLTAVTQVQIPSGTPSLIPPANPLQNFARPLASDKLRCLFFHRSCRAACSQLGSAIYDFCDGRFSRLAAVSVLVNRFMAAMINTSSSVKARVVIFHITASQLVRSVASLSKARTVPNAVAHVSDGKVQGLQKVD